MRNLPLQTTIGILFFGFIYGSLFANSSMPGENPRWVTFTSEEEKVRIKFPGEPEVTDEMRDDGGHHVRAQYNNENNCIYMFDVVRHTADLSFSEDLPQVSLNSFLETLDQKDYESDDYIVGKHKGLKALIHLKDNGITIDYRVLIAGQRQVQIIVMMPRAEWDQDVADKFFKSFKLLK